MRREYAGLAVLVLALTVALPFILIEGEGDAPDPLPTATEVPTYTATAIPPSPTATTTPVPDRGGLPAPEFWTIAFYRLLAGVSDQDDAVFRESLSFEFDGPPFGEYRDGAWGLTATGSWGAQPAGRYTFSLEFDCALTVRLGDRTVAEASDAASVRSRTWEFVHAGGPLELTIDAAAGPGHFLIRWQ